MGRSARSSRQCPVSANAIATQLVKNGAYKAKDRQASRLVAKEVSALWKIPTPPEQSICGDFTPEEFANPDLVKLGNKVTVRIDDNPDHNALAPQNLTISLRDGSEIVRIITDNLGSPTSPMSEAQNQAKRDLAQSLASAGCDPRIFDDPLAYATEPR